MTYKNPCIDTTKVKINGPTTLATLTYQWGAAAVTTAAFSPLVTVSYTPSSLSTLCGGATVTATYNSVAMTSSTQPMAFNSAASTFTLRSTSASTIQTTKNYSIKAVLTKYPSTNASFSTASSLTATGSLKITGDPCDAPLSFTAPTQPNFSASANFANTVSFTLSAFTVNPSSCNSKITYKFLSSTPAGLDLTKVTFSGTLGTTAVTLTTTKSDYGKTYLKPGTYTITIQGEVKGAKNIKTTRTATTKLTIVDPCATATIAT